MGWGGAEVLLAPMGCGRALPWGSSRHGAPPPFPGLFTRSARGSVSELFPAWAPGGLWVEIHCVWHIPPQGERLCRHQRQEHSQQEVSKFLLLHPCGLSLKDWSLLESFMAAPMETVHSRAVLRFTWKTCWLHKLAVKTSQMPCVLKQLAAGARKASEQW